MAKLLNNNTIVIYHDTKDKDMKPAFGLGKKNTDYGVGFYCTSNKNLAK